MPCVLTTCPCATSASSWATQRTGPRSPSRTRIEGSTKDGWSTTMPITAPTTRMRPMMTMKISPPPTQLNKQALFRDLGYEPHPGQAEIHASTASRRVVASGVRWGKSRCAAMEALASAMEARDRSIGWVVAPTYDLSDKIFREIVIVVAQHLRHRIVTLKDHEKKLVLRNMAGGLSEIRGKSTDNPVSLLGEGLDWLIVDEAARMKPSIWEGYLTQRLIDRKGWALLISTPKGKGWFYDLFRRGQGRDPDYQSWNSPSWENPFL